jgi:hypothetical protein
MKRGKPLRRKTPLRRKSKTSKYARRPRDLPYMKLVHRLPCIVREFGLTAYVTTCYGRIEADHMGRRAFGQKADDKTCVAICAKHHRERHDRKGTFEDFTKTMMREFCDWAIARTQVEVAQLQRRAPK